MPGRPPRHPYFRVTPITPYLQSGQLVREPRAGRQQRGGLIRELHIDQHVMLLPVAIKQYKIPRRDRKEVSLQENLIFYIGRGMEFREEKKYKYSVFEPRDDCSQRNDLHS